MNGLKVVRRLLVVLVVAVGLFVLSNWPTLSLQFRYYHSALTTTAGQLLNQDGSSASSGNTKSSGLILRNTQDATTQTGANATPVEAAVQGVLLDHQYTYQFARQTPLGARRVLTNAIQTYNDTGLVHLTPGSAKKGRNHLTLGVYRKQEPKDQSIVEYGHGGPLITQRINWRGIETTNAATAKLNATYPQSFKNSVAVHEVGHALGLDHSSDKRSVMTPIDQGRTVLSAADRKSLKAIYQKALH